MATKLDKTLKREISIGGKGLELAWKDLTSGDAALATALNASLAEDRRRAK